MNKKFNIKTKIASILLIVLVFSFYSLGSTVSAGWWEDVLDYITNLFSSSTATTTSVTMEKYFDKNIPGFDICTELRHLTDELDPTLLPPYEVGLTASEDVDYPSGTVWGDTPTTTATTTFGSIFQKWFLDACIMDGYLTEVAHIDLTHRFEIEGSVFARELADQIALTDPALAASSTEIIEEGINLGILFQEAFMEVTRADGLIGRNVDPADPSSVDDSERLARASLKDFFLAMKDSNEQFTTDLLQAISEKETLNLEYLKSYELAKIEKAREDVNKLTYEVYRELIEEPLIYDDELKGNIVRSLGLKVVDTTPVTTPVTATTTCPFGVLVKNDSGDFECVVVKKEGRIIQNLDDFIYEEAIQKARDFLMCYFAPWRHFPIGEDYWFASSPTERQKIMDKYGDGVAFRDGTKPDFAAIDAAMGASPVCGEAATQKAREDCVTVDFSYIKVDSSGATTTVTLPRCPTSTDSINRLQTSNLRQIMECRTCTREGDDTGGLTGIDGEKAGDPGCNYEYICEQARLNAGDRPDMFESTIDPDTGKSSDFETYVKKLCPSDQVKEMIKRDMLLDMARKYKFLYTAPPEYWYYGLDIDTTPDKEKCALIQASLGHDIDGVGLTTLDNVLRSNTLMAYSVYQRKIWGTELPISVAYRPDPTDEDYMLQGRSLTTSDKFGLQSYAEGIISEIIEEYQALRSSEYLVGEGLRNEKHLVGFPDKDGKYFFIDTENIISPALFLKEKVAASTQAQFDLAQLAWKQNPDNGGENWICPHPAVPTSTTLVLDDFDDPPGPYIELEDICKDPNEGLEHGWYLVETAPSTATASTTYECYWPQFNDITCSVFGYIKTQAIKDTSDLPNELPAPWEDFGEYMQIPDEYSEWLDTDIVPGLSGENAGVRAAPPAFDLLDKFDDVYGEPEDYSFYKEAYGDEESWPTDGLDKYYTNKWYKGVTQLYSKPMSEILRTWFESE